MKCPFCGSDDLGVLESRTNGDGVSIRRRRECAGCKKRFTTYERIEGPEIFVLKKDGRKEQFDREKLRRGIVKATWKRPVTLAQIEELIETIEQKVRTKNTTEVKSWEIGNLVINRLKRLDAMAYLLFASVYRDFQDLKDFAKEIRELRKLEKKRKTRLSPTLSADRQTRQGKEK